MSDVPRYLAAPAYTGPMARPDDSFSMRDFVANSGAGGQPAGVSPNWAIAAGVFSQLASAYAGFHQARMATFEAKSQASAFGHRAVMLQMDQRAAERRAASILEQGQSQVGAVTLEGGQRRAAIEAATAARGVEAGVGSAAEVQASEKLIQDIDVSNVTLGAVQAANAARTGAVAIENEARAARVSSRNLRRSARVAAPETHLFAGLANAGITGYAIDQYRRT